VTAIASSDRSEATTARRSPTGTSSWIRAVRIGSLSRKIGARFAALLASCVLAVACADIRSVDEQQPSAHHTVRTGETIGSIAAAYGVNPGRLASVNGLSGSRRVSAGRRLVIPDGGRLRHRVQRGETLQEIAALYHVDDSTIERINRVSLFQHGQRIRPGVVLVMPRNAVMPARDARPTPERVASRPRPSAPVRPTAVETPTPEPPREPARDVAMTRASKLVDRAVAEYRAANFAGAIEHAGAAESALAQASGDRDARELSARAVFVTGSALAAQGDNDRAKEAFARVHALDPGFEPPRGWLSPRLQELYADARPEDAQPEDY
jgi:LysM repeat protein